MSAELKENSLGSNGAAFLYIEVDPKCEWLFPFQKAGYLLECKSSTIEKVVDCETDLSPRSSMRKIAKRVVGRMFWRMTNYQMASSPA
jgi:hypothetical protein